MFPSGTMRQTILSIQRHRLLDAINVVTFAVVNAERLATAKLQRPPNESSPYAVDMRQAMLARVELNAKRALKALESFKAMVEDESTPPIKLVEQCATVFNAVRRLVREEEDYLHLALLNLNYIATGYILAVVFSKCSEDHRVDWGHLERELASLVSLLRTTMINAKPMLLHLLTATIALRAVKNQKQDIPEKTLIFAPIDAVINLIHAYRRYIALQYRLRSTWYAEEIRKRVESIANNILSALCEMYRSETIKKD